ncbi:YtxH domain-containing protein [Bacillus sp. Marseille-Q3570]|uniref:YtxH domain-containing protein n=1 Tax=Bacillus sp. Marseille-Q3570 TaxID=2963522 RepID=UPI0021B80293|nr:YtxH domain-containing protein [Bacillus sp. Marseille-Q3570]
MTQSVYTPDQQKTNQPTPIKVNKEKEGSLLWKGILIGAVVGGVATLINRNTRKNVQERSIKLKDQTSSLYKTVREDPTIIMNTVKHTMDTTSKALNDLSREVREVIQKVDEVRQHSVETYSSMKEVGGELKDVSGKVREAGREITDIPDEEDNKY